MTVVVAGIVMGSRPAAAASIEISGATLGCFGSGCSLFTSPATNAADGLTFTGAAFDVFTNAGGSVSTIDLGQMARGNVNVSSNSPAVDFTLHITFILPTGLPASYDALITGASPGGGAPLNLDFDNSWQTISYVNGSGSGSFQFALLNDLSLNKNNSVEIDASVRNATFTLSSPGTPRPCPNQRV